MGRGLTSSFRTRGDRRPRQAIISAPPFPLVIAAPYSNDRGSRMELADRRSLNVACDLVLYTTGLISPNLKARVGLRVTPPTLRFGVGSFFVIPQALQRRVGDLTESFQTTVPPDVFFKLRSLSVCAKTLSETDKSHSR